MTRWMETKSAWTRKHLLGLEELSADEIRFVLDTADSFKEVSTRRSRNFRPCEAASSSMRSSKTRPVRARAFHLPPSG